MLSILASLCHFVKYILQQSCITKIIGFITKCYSLYAKIGSFPSCRRWSVFFLAHRHLRVCFQHSNINYISWHAAHGLCHAFETAQFNWLFWLKLRLKMKMNFVFFIQMLRRKKNPFEEFILFSHKKKLNLQNTQIVTLINKWKKYVVN